MKGNVKCPCCGLDISHKLRFLLESLERDIRIQLNSKFELMVNSGARCEKHNKNVGGSPTSSHLIGLAADIPTHTSRMRYLVMKHLFTMNIKRILIYRTFIHFDIDPNKTQKIVVDMIK